MRARRKDLDRRPSAACGRPRLRATHASRLSGDARVVAPCAPGGGAPRGRRGSRACGRAEKDALVAAIAAPRRLGGARDAGAACSPSRAWATGLSAPRRSSRTSRWTWPEGDSRRPRGAEAARARRTLLPPPRGVEVPDRGRAVAAAPGPLGYVPQDPTFRPARRWRASSPARWRRVRRPRGDTRTAAALRVGDGALARGVHRPRRARGGPLGRWLKRLAIARELARRPTCCS
jgi:hypothetical protein